MNIGQIARNQKMLYNIENKTLSSGYPSTPTAAPSSKLSAYRYLLNGFGSGAADDGNNFFSTPASLQGTVRQIAQRLYDASFSSDAVTGENGAGLIQGEYTGSGDPALQALRKHLGAKVDSLQQQYQPDQTSLSGNFEQLQAIAESCVSRLQTVTLTDETTKKIQELALRDAKGSAGAQENSGAEGTNMSSLSQNDRLGMIREEVQKYAPSKRAAALNTINRVWQDELDRIGTYIREKDSNWTLWGDKFDVGILDDYKAGVNVWA